MIITGYCYIQDSDTFYVQGDVSITAGYLVIYNNACLSGQAGRSLTVSGSGSDIYCRGSNNFPVGFGSYAMGDGTYVRYDADMAQTVRGGINYHNLYLQYSTKTFDGAADVDGDLELVSNVVAFMGNYSHSIAMDIENGNGGTIISNGTVTMDAADRSQTIESGTYSFRHLTLTNSAPSVIRTKNLDSDISVNGDFTVTNTGGSGALYLIVDPDGNNITNDGEDSLFLGKHVRLYTSGGSSWQTSAASFEGVRLSDSCHIRFDGGAQNIPGGFSYGSIEFYTSGNKTAQAQLDINGSISRTAGTPVFIDGGFHHTVAGNWTLGTSYYTAPAGTITFDGTDQAISGSNFPEVLISGTGTKTLSGDIDLSGGLTISNGCTLSALNQDIDVAGDWDNSGTGVFTQTTGYVYFDGAGKQTVTSNNSSYFGYVRITKTGNDTVQLNSNIDINQNLYMTADNAVLDARDDTVTIARYSYFYSGSDVVSNSNTLLHWDGDSRSYVYDYSGISFPSFWFSGSGIKYLSLGPYDVNGDITIDNTTIHGDNDTIFVSGNWNNTGSFQYWGSCAVIFDGAKQNISSSDFANLVISGSDTTTLTGDISTRYDLTISDGAVLDVGANNYRITVSDDWYNTGTGRFMPRSGTVVFSGDYKNVYTGGLGAGKRFYDVEFTCDAGERATLTDTLDVDHDLTVSRGYFRTDEFDVYVGGDFIVDGGILEHNNNSSTITFDATSDTQYIDAGGYTMRDVVVDAGGAACRLVDDLTMYDDRTLTISAGSFETNGKTLTMDGDLGDVNVTGGTLYVDAGGELLMDDNASVTNAGGTFKVVGDSVNPATIGRTGTSGGYTVLQTAGTIEARYYTITATEDSGLSITGGTIHATNNFSDGQFTSGAGSQYLNLTGINFADFTATDAVFMSGPTNNVKRLSGTGDITFETAGGDLAGAAYENDGGTLINWTYPGGVFWDGGGDGTDWNDDLNWVGDAKPTASSRVYLNHDNVPAYYTVQVMNANAVAKQIVVDAQGGNPIALTLAGYDLDVSGNIEVNASCTLNVTNATDSITLGGSWINGGTFNHGNGIVIFDSSEGSHSISAGGDAFYNIKVDSGAATYQLAGALTIDNDLDVNYSTLDVSSAAYQISITNDWSNTGTNSFNPRNGTVVFQCSGPDTQDISGGPFYDFTTSNPGDGIAYKRILSNLDIDYNVTIAESTTLIGSTFTVYIAHDWHNNAGSYGFSQNGTGVVIFDGTISQDLDYGDSATTFNNLTIGGTNHWTYLRHKTRVAGDLVIASDADYFDVMYDTIVGVGGSNTLTVNYAQLWIRDVSNFPQGFETINLATNSTVVYYSNADQTIHDVTYGNLTLRRINAGSQQTKTASADLVVKGQLYVYDVDTELDMDGHDLYLSGNLAFPSGGRVMQWGSGILHHVGTAEWNIDGDITNLGGLNLSNGRKDMAYANLKVGGDVTVQSGVDFDMNQYTLQCTVAAKTFTLEDGAYLWNNVPATTDTAFPMGFDSYVIGKSSTVELDDADPQLLYHVPVYGNLEFDNGDSVTATGDINVDGIFDMDDVTYDDGGFDLNVSGDTLFFTEYIPSAGTRVTFDGSGDQYVLNDNSSSLNFENLTVTTVGTLTMGDYNDDLNIDDSLVIDSFAIVTNREDIIFSGPFWDNDGVLSHTEGTFRVDGDTSQAIDMGTNTIYDVEFTGTGAKTFSGTGMTVKDDFTISSACTVHTGKLTHVITDYLTITAGVLSSDSTNFTFDGDWQTIAGITAHDVTLTGSMDKTMSGDWDVHDLTIDTSARLTVTSSNYAINVRGDWTNYGVFSDYYGTVTFDGSDDTSTILGGGYNFYDVVFDPTDTVTYLLQSPSTRFYNSLTVGDSATLKLNGKELIFGSAASGATQFTVDGVLDIDAGAVAKFNNDNSQCSVMVNSGGKLRIVGNADSLATVTREVTGETGLETKFIIASGAEVEAKYYSISYLDDDGFEVQSGAIIDTFLNFSEGTWSNLRTSTSGGSKYYLRLDCASPESSIANVTFNFDGTPTVGTHYNVIRPAGHADTITFSGTINGLLAGAVYEEDPDNKMEWPVPTTATWTGAVSTDWNVGGNWSTGSVPDNAISVVIPLVSNNPYVTTADAVCKDATITDGIVTLENGYDLTVEKDITIGTDGDLGALIVSDAACTVFTGGSWTRGSDGVFVPGSGTVVFNSNSAAVTIYPRESAFNNVDFNGSGNFQLSGSDIDVNGNVSLILGTVIPTTDDYQLKIAGNYSRTGGAFSTATVGEVIFDGGNQTISGGTFYTVDVTGTNKKTFSDTNTFVGRLTVYDTLLTAGGAVLDMNEDLVIEPEGVFNDAGSGNHTFSGTDWYNYGSYIGTGTVTFDGVTQQDIYASSFHNLVVSGSNDKDLQGNLTITGNLTVESGPDELNMQTYTVAGTDTFTLAAGQQVYVSGADNFPSGFAVYDLAATSYARYYGTMDQVISGGCVDTPITYGYLELDHPNTKTLDGDIGVAQDINFREATLDASTDNYSITLGDDWNNYNTGSFVPRLGEVILNGTETQYLYKNITGSQSFYKLTINKTGGTAYLATVNQTVEDNLTVYQGTFSTNGYELTIGGDLNVTEGQLSASGTYKMTQAAGSAIIATNNSRLYNLIVDGPGCTFEVRDSMQVTGDFTLTAGTVDANDEYVLMGDWADAMSISGTYIVGPGGVLALGDDQTVEVTSAGQIHILGNADSVATVQNVDGGDYYAFLVNGTIKADYYHFQHMANSGIQVTSSGTVDTTYDFNNGTFSDGYSGGVYLSVENTQKLTITNVTFADNPGNGAYNVEKATAVAGTLIFSSVSGEFAGGDYENDPNGLINWIDPVTLTWTGATNTDWYTVGNWSASTGADKVPTLSENVVIAAAVNQPVLDSSGALANNLTINSGASLTITASDSIDLTVANDVTINGTMTMTGNDTMALGGNWTLSSTGTFMHGSGTVMFNASSGTKTIDTDESPFYNVVFESSAVYQLREDLDADNDLTIAADAGLDVTGSDYAVTVGGSWDNDGTFTAHDGLVTLDARTDGTETLDCGASAFYDLAFAGSDTTAFQLSGDLYADRNVNVTSGQVRLNGQSLYMGDGSGSDKLLIKDTLEVDAGAFLRMGDDARVEVDSGGVIVVVGTDAGNLATVTRQGAGDYGFSVNSGGEIHARFYLFEFMDTIGVSVAAGATVDSANNFSNGTFANGASNGRYLLLANGTFANDTMRTVTFNSGPAVNVRRVSGNDTVVFVNAVGGLSGHMFEDDNPNGSATTGLLRWHSTFTTYTWTGNTDSVWNTAANWDVAVPSGNANVIIPDVSGASGNNPFLLSGPDGETGNLTIYSGGHLTIGADMDLEIQGMFVNSGTLTVVDTSETVIKDSSSWSNDGVMRMGDSSTVVFNGSGAVMTIQTGGESFRNLTIDGTGTVYLAAAADIDGDFTITAGTFDVSSSSYQMNVGGDWNNSGTFVDRTGTVVFDGNGPQELNAGGAAAAKEFYNVQVSKTGDTLKLDSAVVIKNDLTLSSGTFSIGSDTVTLAGNWQNTGGAFAAGLGLVRFDGTDLALMSTNNQDFGNVAVAKTGGGQVTVNTDVTVNGNLDVTSGTMYLNGYDLTFGDGTDSIRISGTIYIDAGAYLKMYETASAKVNSGGVFKVLGNGSSARAYLTSLNTTAGWDMMVNGTIQAEYAAVSYTGRNGITVSSSGAIHGSYNFSKCTFDNAAGTAVLTLLNDQVITMDSVRIDTALAGRATYNVQSTAGSGQFRFENSSGTFAREAFENDDGGVVSPGRIVWATVRLYVNGVNKNPDAVWPNEPDSRNIDMLLLKFFAEYDTILLDSLIINLGGTDGDTNDLDTIALYSDLGGSADTMIPGAYGFFDSLGTEITAVLSPSSPLVIPENETLRVHVVFDVNPDVYPADTLHSVSAVIADGDSIRSRPKNMVSTVMVAGTFPLQSGDMSLPVELSSFTATASVAGVELAWRTESETENMGFNVYRSSSADGPWSCLNPALVAGAWNSEHAHEYRYTDGNVLPGAVYWYRIADVTAGGLETLHEPVRVVIPVPGTEQARERIEIGPNPVVNRLSVSCLLEAGETGSVVLYTGDGRPVMERVLAAANGRNEYRFNLVLDRLDNGIYALVVRLPGLVRREMIILYR